MSVTLEDEIPEDRDAGAPFLLVAPEGAATDNKLRLLHRLKENGYGVVKEYDSEYQSVYSITPAFSSEE